MSPRITVVIPYFNNVKTVVAAVKSAVEQKGVDFEIIVVDDGSIDGSREVLEPFSSRMRLIKQANQGACVARNRGLQEASGEFIKFLDADDELHPQCLVTQLQQAKEVEPNVIVFGRADWVDQSGSRIATFPSPPMRDGQEMDLTTIIDRSPLTSCPLHRRSLLAQIGAFNEDCPRGQEHDLHVRLALNGARFVFRDTFCYWYHQHVGTNRISARQYHRNVCEGQMRVYEQQVNIARERSLLREETGISLVFARNWWRHGRLCLRAGHTDLAQACFEESRVLMGGRTTGSVGSRIYLTLNRFLGPVVAESLLRSVRP